MNQKDTAPFLHHCPTPENPTPLPCGRQIGDKVNIYFADDRLIPVTIVGVFFYDAALYYHCQVSVVTPTDEWFISQDVPATLLRDPLPMSDPA